MQKFRLYAQSDPQLSAEFYKEKVAIGRAKTNDFVINDGTVSRNQADVALLSDGYTLTNIGSAPILVNGKLIDKCLLKHDDVIAFGCQNYVFQIFEVEDTDDEDETLVIDGLDKTVVGAVPAILIGVSGEGKGETYVLDRPAFVIGRADDCDVIIKDSRVSRKHAVIEQRADEYYLVRHAQHQAVLVNHQPVNETRLYNNDHIEVFTLSFSFRSTNPNDQRKRADVSAPVVSQTPIKQKSLASELSPKDAPEAMQQSQTPQAESALLSSVSLNSVPLNSATLVSKQEPKSATKPAPRAKDQPQANQTMIQPRIVAQQLGPRLVCHGKGGESTNHAIKSGRNVIGRDPGCEVVVSGDESVSRSHAEIEKKSEGHFVTTLSANPVLVNGKKAKPIEQIYSGDSLQVGATLLTFVSELREDERPARKGASRWLIAVVAVLALSLMGVLTYRQLWEPYHLNSKIESVRVQVESKEFSIGLARLRGLYKEKLDVDQRARVTQLMATAVQGMVDIELAKGSLETAKIALEVFLRQFGAEKQMEGVWKKLNEVRFLAASQYQKDEQTKLALNEYLAIDSDSDYYAKAQQAISDIWLLSQEVEEAPEEESAPAVNIDALLQQAENLFTKQYYLSPLNNNAYGIYLKILQVDPGNETVLGKIEKIKTFYRFHGQNYCSQGNKTTAETYFRRFLIIEPGNVEVMQRLGDVGLCESASAKLLSAETQIPAIEKATDEDTLPVSKSTSAENKQKVRKLLEEEGVQSEWIVDYLFDEKKGDDSGDTDQHRQETPW